MKKIEVAESTTASEIEKINKEIEALEKKLDELEDKRVELVEKELKDKIIVTPVVVVRRPLPLFDMFGMFF